MAQRFNWCTIYTGLWCIMHLKGVLYSADAISVAVYWLIMLMSIICFIKVIIKPTNLPILKALNVLTIMFIIYGVFNIVFEYPIKTSWNIIPTDFYLKNLLNSLLPIYSYYYFAQNGYITKKWIICFAIVFLVIAFGRYIVSLHKAMERRLAEGNEVTNNAGYYFVALMPLACFFNKRPLFQYIYLALCMVMILAAMKRGAILIGSVCMIWFLYRSISTSSNWTKFMYIILSVAIVLVVYYFVSYQLETNLYFQSRLEATLEGNSSSRDKLYTIFYDMIFDRNIFYMLFGQGADSTIRLGPNYAHNDWLEIGVNQGFLGIIIYAFFIIQLFRFWFSIYGNTVLKTAIGMAVIIFFLKSIFSMSVNNLDIYVSLLFGYSMAWYNESEYKGISQYEDSISN